jgi:hypothetical protein
LSPNSKLALGSVLAVVGGVGIVLGLVLGAGDMGRPWSFLLGFVLGIVSGAGVALSISGLLAKR